MDRPKYIIVEFSSYVPKNFFNKNRLGDYLRLGKYIEDWKTYTAHYTLDEAIEDMVFSNDFENTYTQATEYDMTDQKWLNENPADWIVVNEFAIDEIEYLDNGKWALKANLWRDRTLSFLEEKFSEHLSPERKAEKKKELGEEL